jgi:hypothetical protein
LDDKKGMMALRRRRAATPLRTTADEPRSSDPDAETVSFRDLLARPAVYRSLLVVLVWRVVVAVVGVLSYYLVKPCACRQGSILHDAGWSPNPLSVAIDAMYRGDATFYVSLARDGYHYSTHHTSTMGFFPAFSALIKGLSLVTGNVYAASAIVPTVCLFGAVALFAVWLEERGLGRRAPLIVAFWLCFPFSLFYGAIYTEPVFLLLVLAAFLGFERRRWYLVALLVAGLTLLRPNGAIVVVPAIVVMALASREHDWRAFLAIPAAALSLAGFMVYQWVRFGTPLAYVHAKSVPGWEVSPHRLLADFLLQGQPGRSTALLALMAVIGLLFLATVPLVYRSFGLGYALFSFLCVVGSLPVGLPGLDRYVIVAFPSFVAVFTRLSPKVAFCLGLIGFYGLLLCVVLFQKGLSVT